MQLKKVGGWTNMGTVDGYIAESDTMQRRRKYSVWVRLPSLLVSLWATLRWLDLCWPLPRLGIRWPLPRLLDLRWPLPRLLYLRCAYAGIYIGSWGRNAHILHHFATIADNHSGNWPADAGHLGWCRGRD